MLVLPDVLANAGRRRRLVLRVGAGPAGVLLARGRGEREAPRHRRARVRGGVADARELRDRPADGVVRARRAARRRGDDDAGPLSVAGRVTVSTGSDCSLCARALEVVAEARLEVGFELEVVDIGGDAELEARYRELLPVVEIDGEQAFTYFVDPDALRGGSPARDGSSGERRRSRWQNRDALSQTLDRGRHVTERLTVGVAARLSRYLQVLTQARKMGKERISSQEISEYTNINATQIRRDLSAFGRFGKRGVGYRTDALLEEIRQILARRASTTSRSSAPDGSEARSRARRSSPSTASPSRRCSTTTRRRSASASATSRSARSTTSARSRASATSSWA